MIRKRYRQIVFGSVIIALILFAAIFAPLISGQNPMNQDVINRLKAPSTAHPFGTDQYGRDVLARILYGARITLYIGIMVVLLSGAVGIAIGLLSGYFKAVDTILMRVMDAMMAFPSILLAMVLVAALGPGTTNIILALAITNIPRVGRMVRGVALLLKRLDHVEAAQAAGAGHIRILLVHILPLCWAPVIVMLTSILASTALAEASLTFLGVGLRPDIPSWGAIINEGRMHLRVAPWLTLIPGFSIMATVLSLNLMGDSLRDLLDPRLKEF